MNHKGESVNASDLVEIEAIKQLKARYFRFLDTKQWDAWKEIFTEDFRAEIHGPHPVIQFENRDEMVESNRKILSLRPADSPSEDRSMLPFGNGIGSLLENGRGSCLV